MRFLLPFLTLGIISLLTSCSSKGGGLNLYSVSQDAQLGAQVNEQILSDPKQFPVLDKAKYPEAYKHIQRITNTILNSGQVELRNDFKWEVRLINDSKTLNAFCTPGGYIYVYSGLIKFLDSEDQLAGVMGHEIAHADRRHSTKQMTKMTGVSILSQVLLGNQQALANVANQLVGLKFSRSHETDADDMSVKYLCATTYKADGAAGFFEKLTKQEGSARPPEFLSTHPNPDNRVAHIITNAKTMGCKGTAKNIEQYNAFKKSLP